LKERVKYKLSCQKGINLGHERCPPQARGIFENVISITHVTSVIYFDEEKKSKKLKKLLTFFVPHVLECN